MAPRAYWRGFLRLSLVSLPVQLYPAVDQRHDVPLHQIHRPSGERVRHEKVVPGIGPVASEDIVMGYEVEGGRHVLLEDEDLDFVALETSGTIELEQFIDAQELDDVYVDRPYFVVPADKVGGEAYRVLRAALKDSGRIGIGEVVLHKRERIVAVRPCGRGLMLETLRYAEELREADRYFGELDDSPPDPRTVELARELIERRSAPFRPDRFKDDYEAALRALIQRKLRGQRAERRLPTAPPAEVVDLMQALKRSLDSLGAGANANEPRRHGGGERRSA
jgi:DNA end-binding protein Ku